MTNSTKTTKYSTMFLAAILVAGTITTFFPSFMVGTSQAVQYPDMDREKKEDKKNVSIQSLKCNNINVNVNGLELSVLPSFLGGGEVAAEAVEPNTDASSFAGNKGDGSEINDFRFICINNNNNTVIEAGNESIPIPPTPPVDPCEDCFRQELTQEQIDQIVSESRPFPVGTLSATSLAELCEFLRADLSDEDRIVVYNQLDERMDDVMPDIGIESQNFILNCLVGLGLIVEPPPPPPP